MKGTNGLYYVYTLSANGIVFYVGATTSPTGRYQKHITYNDATTAGTVYNYRKSGVIPTFKIVFLTPDYLECELFETALIQYYSNINNPLCNKTGNAINNRIICPIGHIGRHTLPRLKTEFSAKKYVNELNNRYGKQ